MARAARLVDVAKPRLRAAPGPSSLPQRFPHELDVAAVDVQDLIDGPAQGVVGEVRDLGKMLFQRQRGIGLFDRLAFVFEALFRASRPWQAMNHLWPAYLTVLIVACSRLNHLSDCSW